MKKRILGLDVARALAIFGMVIVNYREALDEPVDGPAWLVSLTSNIEGKASATFVVLAGIGLSLLFARKRSRDVLVKRGIFLFVAGYLFATVWPGDILHYYGVFFLLGALLVGLHGAWLWSLVVAANLVFFALISSFDYEKGWIWETLTYTDFWTPAGLVRNLFFNGYHPLFPWIGLFTIGIWLGRRKLSSLVVAKRMFFTGLGMAVGIKLLSLRIIGLVTGPETSDEQWEYVEAIYGTWSMPPLPMYFINAVGAAMAVIGLCLWLTRRFKGGLVSVLSSAGRMSFTLYILHVLPGILLPFLFLRITGGQQITAAFYASICFCILAAPLAYYYKKRFAYGPLEWLMRRLTA